jgi:hypothetical protein
MWMRRLMLAVVTTLTLAGCGQGVWLSRQDAINHSVSEKGVSSVTRREAKLMTWQDFLNVTHLSGPNVDAAKPPAKQKVWLVAVSGNVQMSGGTAHWAIFVYNAVTGALIGVLPEPVDPNTGALVGGDWPPDWSSFPDSG